jgi:RecG-like helicase
MATIARNLGAAGRRQRLITGAVGLGLGLVAAALLILTGADRGLRVILVVPFGLGAIGLLQARDST